MTTLYSTWLLVAEPRHMPLEWSSTCEGYRETKRPKQDSGSSEWYRQRNQCGSLMDDASVYNMNDRSYMRNGGGKED
jgi:hypothetical protein